jgi:LysM repeat protein
MVFQVLLSTILAAVAVSAAPLQSVRRDLSTVISQCHHDFAYTWDDGPYIYHQEVSTAFSNVGGHTTFFMNGDNWSCIYDEANVQAVRAAYEAGHQVASHTWSHADLTTLSHAQIDVEIQRLDEAFIKILGIRPRFLRPPYGSINDAAATYIQQTHGKTIVLWSDDSGDSVGGSAQDSYNFYQGFANQGPSSQPRMTLSHETEPSGIGALRMGTVPLLANAGITLSTVAQCLDAQPYDYIGSYGTRDSSWTCSGTWNPPTTTSTTATQTSSTSSTPAPTCVTTYYSVSGDTCDSIGAKYGLSGTAISQANTFITCSDIWAGTPVCIPSGGSTPTSTSSSSTPAPSCASTYTSVSGDTCVSIGSKYGLTDTAISQANTFINCSDIWVGTSVCIPPPGTQCAQSYTSVAGDNCSTVASKFGVTAAQISLWNYWVNCSDVWTGTVLCVKH